MEMDIAQKTRRRLNFPLFKRNSNTTNSRKLKSDATSCRPASVITSQQDCRNNRLYKIKSINWRSKFSSEPSIWYRQFHSTTQQLTWIREDIGGFFLVIAKALIAYSIRDFTQKALPSMSKKLQQSNSSQFSFDVLKFAVNKGWTTSTEKEIYANVSQGSILESLLFIESIIWAFIKLLPPI